MRTSKLLIFSIAVMSLLFVTCSGFLTCLEDEPKEILSKDKTITKVALNINPKVTATVDDATKKITATVPFGTDLTKVTLAISHSGASISPEPKTVQDFSNGKSVKYTVKAEDGTTQEYTVNIGVEETILQSASISAFMGESGSDISISIKPAGNYKLYISNDENCDISNYNNCANAEMIEINGDSKTFNSKTLTTAKEATTYFKIQDRKGSYNIAQKANVFSPRSSHQVVVFKDKMYIIAGYDGANKNDVYSSEDGAVWKQITTSGTIFSPRIYPQVVVFKDKMYLIGGSGGFADNKNDVYSSSDGTAWKKEIENAAFSPRNSHQVVVFKGKMYLIGGYDGAKKNDVYSSSDGTAWKKEIENAAFSPRNYHQVVVFKGKMYLISGYDGAKKNDVYSSEDGAVWKQITTSGTILPARFNPQVVVLKDKMYLIGGLTKKNDIYSSSDGTAWKKEIENAAFPSRNYPQVVVFKDKMYLIGGYDGARKNDVWQSSDGITWKKGLGLSFSK